MGLNRVLFRSIGNKLSEGTTKIMDCRIPNGATSFDYITASGKRNFRVLTFKDEAGKPVLKKIDFLNGEGPTTRFVEHNSGAHVVYNLSDKNNSICIRTFFPHKNKTYMIQNDLEKNGDRHSFFALEQGKSRKGITYETKWDGNKPNIEYINTDKRLDEKNLEYLPLGAEYGNPYRNKKRFKHICKIQEKQLGLEGLAPKPKFAPQSEVMKDVIYECNGETDIYNGQITISNTVDRDSATLLNILGHEYRHLKDFFNIHRLKFNNNLSPDEYAKMEKEIEELHPGATEFDKIAETKGLIKEHSQMDKKYRKIVDELNKALSGDEYSTSAKGHDSFSFERRANASGKKEVDKLWEVVNRVQNFVLNA